LAVIANASSLLFRVNNIPKDPNHQFQLFVYPAHFFGVISGPSKEIQFIRQFGKRPDSDSESQIGAITEELEKEWSEFQDSEIKVINAGKACLAADLSSSQIGDDCAELINQCFFCSESLPHPHFAWLKIALQSNWNDGVYLEFSGSTLSAFVKSEGQIQIYNQYDIRGSKDALYFTLLIYKQLGQDVHSTPLYVGGAVSAESEVMSWFRKYIQEVSLFNGRKVMESWPFDTHEMPWHFYPSLISHLICE
jgi:hypothetical protein